MFPSDCNLCNTFFSHFSFYIFSNKSANALNSFILENTLFFSFLEYRKFKCECVYLFVCVCEQNENINALKSVVEIHILLVYRLHVVILAIEKIANL